MLNTTFQIMSSKLSIPTEFPPVRLRVFRPTSRAAKSKASKASKATKVRKKIQEGVPPLGRYKVVRTPANPYEKPMVVVNGYLIRDE